MYRVIKGVSIPLVDFNIITGKTGRYRGRKICDDIMCFDVETTNTFVVDGVPQLFDYDDPKKCKDAPKHSIVYCWQFTINDNVYFGRELKDFEYLVQELHAYCPALKIIFVHNLAFDINFLYNLFDFDIFARTTRHPMNARQIHFNIEFRCSYVLTHLSLDEWGKSKKLVVQKKELDYNVLRTPLTPMTWGEISYCINDVLTMYEGLKEYRAKYGALYNIPMTQTGEMRKACEKEMRDEVAYCKNITKMLPQNLTEYTRYIFAFVGGTVLCNWLYKNRVIKGVDQWDISSSYPWALISSDRYPQSRFYTTHNYKKYMNNNKYVYLIQFRAYGLESRLNCHFLSRSKALNITKPLIDNGRVVSCEACEYVLTSVDFELFEKCYNYESMEILDFRWAKAGYLNNTFRKFILELYAQKTVYKNVDGMEAIYATAKQLINSGYGDFVTKIFSDTITYNCATGEWDKELLDDKMFAEKLATLNKKQYRNYKTFQQGIFVTAIARANLWAGIIPPPAEDDGKIWGGLDEKLCYTDTDSLKGLFGDTDFFERYNARVFEMHKKLANDLGVDIEMFAPKDKDGVAHPIGVYDYEGRARKFKSLGCKQYLLEDEKGKKKLTCAGVSKLAVKLFPTFNDFRIDRTLTEKELKGCFDEKKPTKTAEKLIPYYDVNYPVVKYPDGYVSRYKCGVCLMPTTFNLSMTTNDLMLLYTVVAEKLTHGVDKKLIERGD